MRIFIGAAFTALLTIPSATFGQGAGHPANWSQPAEPFKIIDNIYYVGTKGLSSFLVAGPQGHVLLDGAMPESAPMIAANIRKLGFEPRDVKYLLINHSHYDHSGGLAELKRLTGAKLVASRADKPDLEAGKTLSRPELEAFPAVKVDQAIGDGEQIKLGPVVLTAILTPGHTAGSTSWTTVAAGKQVLFASSVSVAGEKLVANPDYPNVVSDFRNSFARLRTTKADIFLNFHAEGFGLEEKRAAQLAGKADAFIDPGETRRRIDASEKDFDTELAEQTAQAKSR